MHAKQWMMMRILLNHYHPRKPEAVLQCLPQEEIKAILSQEIPPDALRFAHPEAESVLTKIHYSWLIPELQKHKTSTQRLFLAALSESQQSKIQSVLKLPGYTPIQLPSTVKKYFVNTFYRSLSYKEVLPAACLPSSPLMPLSSWNTNALIELIDVLGVYDIVDDVRRIINRSQVIAIHDALSAKQRAFLRSLLPQKEKVIGTPLKLVEWQGDVSELKSLIQKRGILRLGRAFSGQHPDFLWHIAHILDRGRGMALSKFYTVSSSPGITPALLQQVINVMNFLNGKSVQ